MSAHAEIKAALVAHAGLAALVGAKIRADLAQEKDVLPFIVFKRVAYNPVYGLDNSLHAAQETFAIECWATHRAESVAVAEQAMAALAVAGMPATNAEADGIDPELLDLVTIINADVWT